MGYEAARSSTNAGEQNIFLGTRSGRYSTTAYRNVFAGKYALQDEKGNYVELTPNDMHKSLASEFAKIESNLLSTELPLGGS